MSPLCLLPIAAVSAWVFLIAPSEASAQARLDCDLVANAAPGPGEQRETREAARELCGRIAQGDAQEVEDARRALLRPFQRCNEQSIAFRLNFGRTSATLLAPVVAGDDVHRAVNALMGLGPIGIEESTDVIIDALRDPRAGVRLAAASAAADTIQGETRFSLTREQSTRALREAASALADERDPAVAASLVTALTVSRADEELLRLASRELADAVPRLLGALEAGETDVIWSRVLAQAAQALRSGVLDTNPASTQDASLLRAVSRASARILGHARDVLAEADDLASFADTPAARALDDAVTTASSQLLVAVDALGRAGSDLTDLSEAWDEALEERDAGLYTRAIDAARPALDAIGVPGASFENDR